MQLKKLVTEFLEYLEIEKGRSLGTVKQYDFYLRRFLAWAKISKPSFITQDLVREYRLYLNRPKDENDKNLAKNTQNYHLIALRAFLKYLSRRDIKTLAPEQIELAKLLERKVSFLEGDDLERLLKAPLKINAQEIIKTRDKAILETLFSTGLRVSELAGLSREQVNLKKDEFTVRGKGKKLRIVFLSEAAKKWIKDYLNLREDTSPWLLMRHDRAGKNAENNLSPRSIERLVEKYAKAAGITKHISPHTLRHSFATDLLNANVDTRIVQEMLGHKSITTTQIYTHITNKKLREVHKKYHGISRKRV
jgi:site-specific recombinase XerD